MSAVKRAWRARHTLASGPTLLGVVALSLGNGWFGLFAIAFALVVWTPLVLLASVRYHRQEVQRHASR